MAEQRNTSRARPPADIYGQPAVSFPTPNRDDLVIIEDLPWKDWSGEILDYGTPHPKQADARLVWQGPAKGNGQERNWRMIYATQRNAEDAYNAASQVDKGSQAYIRQYIIPRDQFTPATLGLPLKSVTGLIMGSQGSGYPKSSEVTVTIGGGGGSGATAKATVQRGKIVAITLTNGGDGYTSAPTVSFSAATGTGATATATIQDQLALLTDENPEPLGDPQLAGLFLSVTRIWHKLPGLELKTYGLEEETRTPIAITEQLIKTPLPGDLPFAQTPGSAIEFRPINSVYGVKITTSLAGIPASRTEYRNVEYTFPALLFGITGALVEARDGTGVVTLQPNRRSAFNRTVRARVAITYGAVGTLGATLPAVFSPRFNDLIFDGVAFNVNERNVLNDAITVGPYSSGTQNPKWPYFTETATFSATSPTATAYSGWIGTTEICVSSVVRPWKLGLERREDIYLTAQ